MKDYITVKLNIQTENANDTFVLDLKCPCPNPADHWYVKEILGRYKDQNNFRYTIEELVDNDNMVADSSLNGIKTEF